MEFKRKYVVIILAFVLFMGAGCSSPNDDDTSRTVTFSGVVSLEKADEHSGVQIMLFKVQPMDTALTHLMERYPKVGFPIGQQSEFYWRMEHVDYQTQTDAQGQWQIENVKQANYHVVAYKEGYGWRVLYEQNGTQPCNFNLKKEIVWQGTIDSPYSVPAESYVKVVGSVEFKQGLVVNSGVIIEFMNGENGRTNIDVQITGDVLLNGSATQPIVIVADDSVNTNDFYSEDAQLAQMNYVICRYVQNGFYFKQAAMLTVRNSRLAHMTIGLNVGECDSAVVEQNVFSHFSKSAVQAFSSRLTFKHNMVYQCDESGLDSKNARQSLVQNNVFKRCHLFALALNQGGYSYSKSYLSAVANDFWNSGTHIYLGEKLFGHFNQNNFYQSQYFHVKSMPRYTPDTLDFRQNFWNTVNVEQVIYDKRDVSSSVYKGPFIEYQPYALKPNEW